MEKGYEGWGRATEKAVVVTEGVRRNTQCNLGGDLVEGEDKAYQGLYSRVKKSNWGKQSDSQRCGDAD